MASRDSIDGRDLPPVFVEYVSKCSRRCACVLINLGFYRWDEVDDLQQDMWLDFLVRLPKFRANRGDLYAFAYSVIKNRANVLASQSIRRIAARNACRWENVAPGTVPAPFRDRFIQVPVEGLNRALDIRRATDRLPGPLKRLFHDLVRLSVPEICTERGVSRAAVYRGRGRIRKSFVDFGLGNSSWGEGND
jgi:DNA-directed RNA polymerase specialized sigma24 family protein